MKKELLNGARGLTIATMILGVAACGSGSKKNVTVPSPVSTSTSTSTSKLSPVSPSKNSNSSKSSSSIKTVDKAEQEKAKKIQNDQKAKEIEKKHLESIKAKEKDDNNKKSSTLHSVPQNSKNNSPLSSRGENGSSYVTSNGSQAAKYYSNQGSKGSYRTVSNSTVVNSRPVSLTIPSIGLYHATILSRGLVGGQLVPPPGYVQWYTGTVKPGDNGISVLAGHVTYYGPDVLYSLNRVPVGAQVTVNFANGLSKTFTVYHKETDNKNNLEYDQRVWGRSSSPVLAIITCDKNSAWSGLHHVNNYVLWAK